MSENKRPFDEALADHLKPIGMGARPQPDPPLDMRALGDAALLAGATSASIVIDGVPMDLETIAFYEDLLQLRDRGLVMFVGGLEGLSKGDPLVHPTTEASRVGDDDPA